MIAEIKEQMGEKGMRQEIYAVYKRKLGFASGKRLSESGGD